MIARLRLSTWDNVEVIYLGKKLPVNNNKILSIGYLEVYESIEDLHKDYPGETNYIEVFYENKSN